MSCTLIHKFEFKFQVFVDQAFFAPVGLSSFYIGLTALEFKTPSEVYEEWWAKFPKTWQVFK